MFGDVAGALLAMLEDRIGPEAWTQDVKTAWTAAYMFVADHMVRGIKKEAKKQKGKSRSVDDMSVGFAVPVIFVVAICRGLLSSFEPSLCFFLCPVCNYATSVVRVCVPVYSIYQSLLAHARGVLRLWMKRNTNFLHDL